MKHTIYGLICAVILLGATTAAAYRQAKHFGEAFTDAKVVELAEIMSSVDKYSGKPLKVEGKIDDVCQERGCWLVVTDGKREMRVTFKGYAFFVPKDAAGKRVILEGTVLKKTITEDHARHYAQESKGKVDPSTIKGPQEVITMVATGVSVQE